MFSPNPGPPPKTMWQRFIDHKHASAYVEQRASLFLGVDRRTRARIEVPLSAFDRGHLHVLGATGSQKTSGTLYPIVLQAIQGYREDDGQWSEKSPVVVFDLKGDTAFFNAVRIAAESHGRTFRFFSTASEHGYHFFDPFQTVAIGGLRPIQLANSLIRGLSLDYGLAYGNQYFTHQNTALLLDAIKQVLSDGEQLTLARLSDALASLGRGRDRLDAGHILKLIHLIADYPQVDLSAHDSMPRERIDMFRAVEQAEVIYIFMDMQSEAVTLRPIAGLLLEALVQGAKAVAQKRGRVPFVYAIVDEFYHVAGRTFGDFLSMARSAGVHFFLANQTLSQLDVHEGEIRDIVRANASVQQIYTLDEADARDELSRQSGPRTSLRYSSSSNSLGVTNVSSSEYLDWHISDDDINAVTDTQLASFLYFNAGRPSVPGDRIKQVLGFNALSKQQYFEYRDTPLPKYPKHEPRRNPDDDRSAAGFDRRNSATASESKSRPPVRKELQDAMAQTWEVLEAELQVS